jgi:hypothetical protein
MCRISAALSMFAWAGWWVEGVGHCVRYFDSAFQEVGEGVFCTSGVCVLLAGGQVGHMLSE